MSNLIVQNNQLDYNNPEVISALKNAITKDLNEGEFFAFLGLCKSTGLNPFTREIWGIKVNGNLQIMIGINGYLRIANQHPKFKGMQTKFVRNAKGDVDSCICTIHREDRAFPTEVEVFMSDYNKGQSQWAKMPRVMLEKVAITVAVRRAFPLELVGTYTEEEYQVEQLPSDIEIEKEKSEPKKPLKTTEEALKPQFFYSIPAESANIPAHRALIKDLIKHRIGNVTSKKGEDPVTLEFVLECKELEAVINYKHESVALTEEEKEEILREETAVNE